MHRYLAVLRCRNLHQRPHGLRNSDLASTSHMGSTPVAVAEDSTAWYLHAGLVVSPKTRCGTWSTEY